MRSFDVLFSKNPFGLAQPHASPFIPQDIAVVPELLGEGGALIEQSI
jgi:hypothetical protein